MFLPEFNYKSAYIVDLENRYAIDDGLLGKHIRISFSEGCFLSIIFPSVVLNNGYPELSIPWLLKKYGVDRGSWGKINSYNKINSLKPIDAWISGILVECFAKTAKDMLSSGIVQNLAKKIVYSLQIINPDSIRIPSDKQSCDLCNVSASIVLMENGKPMPELKFASVLDFSKGRLSIADIRQGITNINRIVSASYELLNNARVNLTRYDTRAAVLNCATSIEVMIKKRIANHLDLVTSSKSLKNYILRQADGYSKQIELCKSFNIQLTGISNLQEKVISIRHRVIHGGYIPTQQEAGNAYRCTKDTLMAFKEPMFEDSKD